MNTNTEELKMEELLEKIKTLEALVMSTKEQDSDANREPEATKINPDDYIKVMSLLPYTLNLSTGRDGTGSTKRFTSFGEIKYITYRELVQIIENHPVFAESGYFYIMDKNVIRQYGLDEVYNKILDKEKIELILNTKDESATDLFISANPRQQEVIVALLVSRLAENPDDVNLNVVEKISDISGVNIREKSKDTVSLQNYLKSLNE